MKKQYILFCLIPLFLMGCGGNVEYLEGTYSGTRPAYTVTINGEEYNHEEGQEIFSFDKNGGCAYYNEQVHDWAYTCNYEKSGNSEFTVYTWDKDKLNITTGPSKNSIIKAKKGNIEISREYAGGLNLKYNISKTSDDFTNDAPHQLFIENGMWDIEESNVWNRTEAISFFTYYAAVSIYEDDTATVHASCTDRWDESNQWTIDCEHADLTKQSGENGDTYYIQDNGKTIGLIMNLNGAYILCGDTKARSAIILASHD